jgi:hypothetical protein
LSGIQTIPYREHGWNGVPQDSDGCIDCQCGEHFHQWEELAKHLSGYHFVMLRSRSGPLLISEWQKPPHPLFVICRTCDVLVESSVHPVEGVPDPRREMLDKGV